MKKLKRFSGLSKFALMVLVALGFGMIGIAFAVGTSIVEMTGSVNFSAFLTYDKLYTTEGEETGNVTVYAHPDRKDYVGSVVIPETVELDGQTYNVTQIKQSAFNGCAGITSVRIPGSITKINAYAFQNCRSITNIWFDEEMTAPLNDWNLFLYTKISSIYIPKGVTSISPIAFCCCQNLTYIEVDSENPNYKSVDNCVINKNGVLVMGCKGSIIPDYVTEIGSNAFRQMDVETITLPSGLKKIGASAFYRNENLKSITIPASVTSIGAGAFTLSGITSGATFENTLGWSAKGTVNYKDSKGNITSTMTADKAFTRTELEDTNLAAKYLRNQLQYDGYADVAWTCSIPDESSYSMLAFTYDDESLTASVRQGTTTPTGDVEIPARVTHNGKVYTVTAIDEFNENSGEGFYDCTGLTSIYIPETITKIGDRTFYGCTSLAGITVSPRNNTYTCENNGVYSGTTLVLGCNSTIVKDSTTAIGNYAFMGSGITSISIPANVTSIGVGAFYCCFDLETFTFAENSKLDSIGPGAFMECESLKELALPDELTTIGALAFNECGLSSLTIPASVNTIGFAAFAMNRAIPSVIFEKTTGWTLEDIPETTDIDSFAGWEDIAVAGQATTYLALEETYFVSLNVSYNFIWSETATMLAFTDNGDGTASVSSAVGSSDKKLATGDISMLEKVMLTYTTARTGYPITSVAEKGFYGCTGLTSINLPNTVTEIKEGAFQSCSNLTSVGFSNSLETIGKQAFQDCKKLTSIDLPASLKTIVQWAFKNCTSLTSLHIPVNVNSISAQAFEGCTGIERMTVDSSNSKYESEANGIYGKNKTNLVLGCKNTIIREGTTSIDASAFQSHKEITSIDIPDTVTSIGYYAFGWGGLTSVEIPASVTSIGLRAFVDSPLTSVTFAEGSRLVGIGESAFQDCDKLTSIIIPAHASKIGANAFTGSGLTSVTFENPYGWTITANDETTKLAKVDLVANGVTYLTDTYRTYAWTRTSADDSDYTGLAFTVISETDKTASVRGLDSKQTSISIPDKVTCTGLTYDGESSWGTVGETYTITEVAAQGFKEYKKMTSLTLPETIVTIRSEAFRSCTGLTSLYIPDSVITIEGNAFNACTQVATLRLSNNLEKISSYAFNAWQKLTELYLPASLKSFEGLGFAGANALTSVIVDEDNPTFRSEGNCVIRESNNALVYGCASSTIPEGISSIAAFAFWSSAIVSTAENPIILPNGLTSIDTSAFQSCGNIETITIPATVKKIGAKAFFECSKLASITFEYSNGWSAKGTVNYKDSDGNITSTMTADKTFTQEEIENVTTVLAYLKNELRNEETPGYADVPWTCDHTPDESYYPMLSFDYDPDTLTASVSSATNSSGARIATGAIVVPEKVLHDGKIYTVTSVADSGFETCSITKMTLPDTITEIGAYAFYSCSSLTNVNIPENVTTIGESAFEGAAITSISIPAATTSIGDWFLKGCSSLTKIQVDVENTTYYSYSNGLYKGTTLIAGCKTTIIKDGTTIIGEYAFYDVTSLTSITIPDSVTMIFDFAFSGCTGLNIVTISETSMLETIASYAFLNCNNLETIELPDSLTNICAGAFQGCSSLERITIPARVETIETCVFSDCSSLQYVIFEDPTNWRVDKELLSAELADTTTAKEYLTRLYHDVNWTHTIYDASNYTMFAFTYDDENMTASVSSAVDSSGARIATGDISIPGIVINGSNEDGTYKYYKVTSVAYQAFYYCSLNSILFPNTITYIADEAFFQAGLTSVYLPASLEATANNPVFGNNIEYISVDKANTRYYSINNGVYYDETAGSYIGKTLISGSVNTILESDTVVIGIRAFRDVQITNITLPSTLKIIREEALEGSALSSITIPMNVEFIGLYAFFGCGNLSSATFEDPSGWKAGTTSLSASYLASTSTAATYLRETYAGYNWTHTYISADDLSTAYPMLWFGPGTEAGTAVVRSAVDENNNHIASGDITVPDYVRIYVNGVEKACEVTTVGNGGFYNSTGLTSITLPNTITMIEKDAFHSSTNLVSVRGVTSIKEIGDCAFAGCTSLKNVSTYYSLEIIGDSAFSGCTSLVGQSNIYGENNFTISQSCSYIGRGAFYNCTSLSINFDLKIFASSVSRIDYWQLEGDNDANLVLTLTSDELDLLIASNYLILWSGDYYWMKTDYPKIRFRDFVEPESDGDAGTCAVSYSKDRSGNKLSTGDISMPRGIYRRGVYYLVRSIAYSGFSECSGITSVSLSSALNIIGDFAFYKTSITSIKILKDVYSISDSAFMYCPLETISVVASNQTYYSSGDAIYHDYPGIGSYLLVGTSNTVIKTSGTVYIYYNAFRDRTNLTSISIPSSVVSIDDDAFRGCSALTSISIPSSVESIGANAFTGCSSLETVYLSSTKWTIWRVTSSYESYSLSIRGLTDKSKAENAAKYLTKTYKEYYWEKS